MPHKRNPVTAEQMTGLARIVRSNTVAGLENVALWSERDISHSSVERVIIPDSCMLVDYLLGKLQWMAEGMHVNADQMAQNIMKTNGLVFSQKILLALVNEGMTREDAYTAVQDAAMRSWNNGEFFSVELMKEEPVAKKYTREQLVAVTDPSSYLEHVEEIFLRCGVKPPQRATKRRAGGKKKKQAK